MTTPRDPDQPGRLEQKARQAREIGFYTAIPTMMFVGPALGWWLGHWAGGRWGHVGACETAGAVLGLLAAIRQIQLIFQRASSLRKEDKS